MNRSSQIRAGSQQKTLKLLNNKEQLIQKCADNHQMNSNWEYLKFVPGDQGGEGTLRFALQGLWYYLILNYLHTLLLEIFNEEFFR